MKRLSFKYFILAAAYLPLVLVQTAQAAALGSKPYVVLRAELLRKGWKPLITSGNMIGGTKEKDVGDVQPMLNAGFTEVKFCSGMDLNYCIFNFKRKNKCMRINTQGEYNALYKSPIVISEKIRHCPGGLH